MSAASLCLSAHDALALSSCSSLPLAFGCAHAVYDAQPDGTEFDNSVTDEPVTSHAGASNMVVSRAGAGNSAGAVGDLGSGGESEESGGATGGAGAPSGAGKQNRRSERLVRPRRRLRPGYGIRLG